MGSNAVLKLGIIGLGHLHPRLYMPFFRQLPYVEVVGVCEKDSVLREPFCNEFGVAGYTEVEQLLNSADLTAAALFLPHADCPAAAELCARSGLHLMVEKPMASTAAGLARIIRAAEDNGIRLTTGYCWRMHPVAREFKRLVQAGIIGKPVGAEGRYAAGRLSRYIEGNAAWMLEKSRSGGGPMFNLGVHWIDLFRWILEDEVGEVCGRNVQVNQDYDIEDNSFALLRFKRGMIASLDISYTVPDSFPHGRDLYLSIRGTLGTIAWSPAYEGEKDLLAVCSDHPEFKGSPRRELAFELEPVAGYSGVMGLEYVCDFCDAVLNDREPAITGQDGLAALKVVEAIYASAEKHCWVGVN